MEKQSYLKLLWVHLFVMVYQFVHFTEIFIEFVGKADEDQINLDQYLYMKAVITERM